MDNQIIERAINRALKKSEVSINQNILLLLPSLSALGFGVHYDIPVLIVFGLILSTIATISVAFTFTTYTIRYCKNKLKNN